jgi:very-short-patch-repair endonuclease
MGIQPDPDWYLNNVLVFAEPGGGRVEVGPASAWQRWWQRQAGVSPIAAACTTQGFVLGSRQLEALGVGRGRTATALRRGRWLAPAYGTVAPIDISDPDVHTVGRRRHALQCAAAVLRRPGHVVSHRSAAVLHGLPTMEIPACPELTMSTSVGLGRRGPVAVRAASLADDEITTWFGVNVTSVPRTLVDVGRFDRRDALMAADASLRERLTSQAAVALALVAARRWPGVRQAREVLAMASPLAESPLESLTRLVLHDDRFPVPELQVAIPKTRFRVDMLWRDRRVILEADGLAKYTDAEMRREKRREHELRALGYRVERVTWEDVTTRWPVTRGWLARSLRLPA